jgi:hypothetical protein
MVWGLIPRISNKISFIYIFIVSSYEILNIGNLKKSKDVAQLKSLLFTFYSK